eukprot:scaffold2836_cov189-Ochromonas_danica.AAC.1
MKGDISDFASLTNDKRRDRQPRIMLSRSILPRDILHSMFRIACVEKNVRKDWSASLTDLRMTETLLLN